MSYNIENGGIIITNLREKKKKKSLLALEKKESKKLKSYQKLLQYMSKGPHEAQPEQ